MEAAILYETEPEPLSSREERLLNRLEETIDKHLKLFRDVGYALKTIRDERLYRIEYDTFVDYCLAEWDLSKTRAYQYIDAYELVENLSTMVDKSDSPIFHILPKNERQARPLTLIPTEQQRKMWAMILKEAEEKGARITATFIQQCIDTHQQKKFKKVVRKAREAKEKMSLLPESVQKSFRTFMTDLEGSVEGQLDPGSRKEIAKMLREILETVEL